jgi:hypothetical protein
MFSIISILTFTLNFIVKVGKRTCLKEIQTSESRQMSVQAGPETPTVALVPFTIAGHRGFQHPQPTLLRMSLRCPPPSPVL